MRKEMVIQYLGENVPEVSDVPVELDMRDVSDMGEEGRI